MSLLYALTGSFDAVLLDIMLPGLSGYRVLERLRAAGVATPVLLVSAKDGEIDQADGLDLGADEYTVGRPHPMMDFGPRLSLLASAVEDSQCGILLLDVVLGHGAHPDPAATAVQLRDHVLPELIPGNARPG